MKASNLKYAVMNMEKRCLVHTSSGLAVYKTLNHAKARAYLLNNRHNVDNVYQVVEVYFKEIPELYCQGESDDSA